ncbi:LuxR family transcriptional regulator [Tropicibacter oceani]|uniref:LuxR family transcriptional regulator n=1 Tax=Tropicibacter oceani TaxID=3058420 RepID=A0ABY8QK61_9RHOB|nr:LuxR family transcriptional regulator [Tropicibacter oceani]WGW04532.1 LuxR family transcriptional regulator [Tropicibacter oceani]
MSVIQFDSEQILNGILAAGSVQSSIEILARQFAIDHVTFHMVSNAKSGMDNPFVRTTYPANWVSHYLLNNYVVKDPILRKALTGNSPFSWSEIEPSASEMQLFVKAAEFGLGQSGYSIPCADPYGRKSVLSLNSHLDHADWTAFLDSNGQDLVGLSKDLHVQAVAEAFAEQGDIPQLSPREFECLRWTAEGKTYSEIAIILDLSEHTVRSYLKVARLKLDSVSLAQAVGRASRLGLI